MVRGSKYVMGMALLAVGVLGACSSSSSSGGSGTTAPGAAGATVAPADAAGTTAAAGGEAPAGDLCSSIPDLATIEAAIGIPVKDPLGVGEPGFQQGCTLLRGTDDFPGITFTYTPGATIAAQIEFVSTNFGIDIVPLDGAPGFYAGEGNSVYWEGNGALYQASATIDGDSRTASLNMLQAWLAM